MSFTHRLSTVIETPRLILKVPTLAEFEPWCAFMADEEAARFIGKTQPPSVVWRGISCACDPVATATAVSPSKIRIAPPAGAGQIAVMPGARGSSLAVARVEIGAPGRLTYGTTRKSAVHPSGVIAQRR